MTLRGRAVRTQGRRTRLAIYVHITLALGIIPAVCIYPYLAAPVSTAAAVLAASGPLLRGRWSSQQGRSVGNHSTSNACGSSGLLGRSDSD